MVYYLGTIFYIFFFAQNCTLRTLSWYRLCKMFCLPNLSLSKIQFVSFQTKASINSLFSFINVCLEGTAVNHFIIGINTSILHFSALEVYVFTLKILTFDIENIESEVGTKLNKPFVKERIASYKIAQTHILW